MIQRRRKIGVIVVWSLGIFVAIFSARYFLDPVPLLRPPDSVIEHYREGPMRDAALNVAPHALENHREMFLLHVGCGVAAMVLGLFQFIASLRKARPAVHRAMGMLYIGAIWVGSITALPLSFFILDAAAPSVRSQIVPISWGFATLSIVWPAVTTMAYLRARQRRFGDHRAWMIRSYSLTFAAVTVRLVSLPLLIVSGGDVFISVAGGIWSWPLNLVVAEWLIRRKRAPLAAPTPAPAV